MDTACHIEGSWGEESTDQQVAVYQKVSKGKRGPETHPEPVDGPSVSDQFTGQKVAGHKDLPKERQGRAVVTSVNDGFSDLQAAGPLQKNSALDTPDPVNLPLVADEFTDQPAVDPGQKDTATKSEENASPTEIVDPSTDMLTDAANSGHKTFRSKVYYLQPQAVWAHADVRLVSSDGQRFKVNAAMLASTSPHLGNVLKSLPGGEDAAISTELCADRLKLFIEFVTSGTLSVKSLEPILDDFACLGVDLLKGYKFQMSYSATSDPLSTAYLDKEESEKKVIVPSVSGVLRKPRILLIPKSQLQTITTTVKPIQMPDLVGKTSKDGTAKKRRVDGLRSNDTFGHFFVCTQPNCARFFKDSTDFYLHKMKCNPKRFEATLSSVKTNPRQARRERREREKEEKAKQSLAPPESREPKVETCDDISIEYDSLKDEDIEREAMEISSAQKSNSHKEKKQEGNSNTIICSIPNCSQVFQDASEYYIHVRNCPPCKPARKKYESPFKSAVGDSTVCSVCGMELSSASRLRSHMESFHVESKTFKCPQCQKVFGSERLVNLHIKKVHNTSTVCSVCGIELSSASSLRSHMESFHVESKTFKCPQCQKVFGSERLVNVHIKQVHNTYICDLCGRLVKTTRERNHKLLYHTPEDQKPLKCKICIPVKGFLYQTQLDEHMNIHTGKKPFKCTSCPGVAYANNANLSAHIRSVHKGIKRKPKNSSIPK